MSMFPGAGAQVYRNEAGEPLGWDYPDQDGPHDPDDDLYADFCEPDDEEESEQDCPDTCPICGMDLKSDGYPLGHKTDEGDDCTFKWATGRL